MEQLEERKGEKRVNDREVEVTKVAGLWGNRQAGSMFDVNKIAPTIKTPSGGYSEPLIDDAQGCSTRTRAYVGQAEQLEVRSDSVSNTVTSVTKDSMALEKPMYKIRKLTPLECFRLQGFGDHLHQALVDEGISNTQLYKMAGNAVSVNVIEALGERLEPYLN